MNYEWASLRLYDDTNPQEGFVIVVRCIPSAWRRKLLHESIRLQMYAGNAHSWRRFPSMEKLRAGEDPTITELNKMFYAARSYTDL